MRLRKLAEPKPTMSTKEPPSPAENKLNSAALPPCLLSYDEIPEWYQDNSNVLAGYRPVSFSWRVCVESLTYLHNESLNIYTHLIPAIFFLIAQAIIYGYFLHRFPAASIGDHLVFAFFLVTAAICLGLSASYHTFVNHSEGLSNLWLRFDFVGIIILTLGDFVSGIYLVFYCEPTLQKVYWATILSLGALTIFLLVSPRFHGRKWRTFRVTLFVGTGLSGFIPLIHGLKLYGFVQMERQSGMDYYFGEGGILILGALVYTTRFPESLKPGNFDIWGSSHQIFHVLVVLATVTHLVGILAAFDYNYHYAQCRILTS